MPAGLFGASRARGVVAAFMLLVLSANSAQAAPRAVKVGIVTGPAGTDDRTAAQARRALTACGKATGSETAALAQQSPEDGAPFTLLATENYDEIIATGPALAYSTSQIARQFIATHFTIVGGRGTGPNVGSILFDRRGASFLAGALGALHSHRHRIAVLGATRDADSRAQAEAFAAGAQYAVNDTRVLVASTEGADVLFELSNSLGDDELRIAAPAGGQLLGRVVVHVGSAIALACNLAASLKPATAGTELGSADGAVSFEREHPERAPAAVRAHFARIFAALSAGSIRLP